MTSSFLRLFLGLGAAFGLDFASCRGESKPEDIAYGSKGVTPLMVAATRGDAAEVGRLIALGADVNARTEDRGSGGMRVGGWTPLLLAAREGKVEVAERLLKAGADVSAATANGRTCLGEAVKQRHPEKTRVALVKLFLAAKADPNRATGQGELPLQLAAMLGHAEVIGPLIDAGAKVNGSSKIYAGTPLLLASRWGRKNAVEELLKRGADRGAKDESGRTAIEVAREQGFEKIVELLSARP